MNISNSNLRTPIIIDNGDNGYKSTDGFSQNYCIGSGYLSDYEYAIRGQNESASWTPVIAQPGQYKIFARWPGSIKNSHNAVFTIFFNGGKSSDKITVNQQKQGDQWVQLGSVYDFDIGDKNCVVLTNIGLHSNENLIADAIKFVSEFEDVKFVEFETKKSQVSKFFNKVHQWQVIEIAFTAQHSYKNPYKEVIADVTFEHIQSGTVITRPVFWDGTNIWRVRFAPIKSGTWKYFVSNCNVPDYGIYGSNGEIECLPPPEKEDREIYRKGFLKIYDTDEYRENKDYSISDVNRRFLTYADGTPFFWSSGTMGNMVVSLNRWKNRDPKSKEPEKGEFQICVDALSDDGHNVIKGEFDEFARCGSDENFKSNTSIFPLGDDKRFRNLTEEDIKNIKNEFDYRVKYIADKGLIWHATVAYADLIYIDENSYYNHKSDEPGDIKDRLEGYKEWTRYLWGRYGAYPVVFSPAWEAPGYYHWHPENSKSLRDERIGRYVKFWNYSYNLVGGYQLIGGLLTMSYPVSKDDGTKEINHTMVYEIVDLPSYQIMMPMQGNWEQDSQGWIANFYTVCKDYYSRQTLKPLLVDETWYDGYTMLEDDNNKDQSLIDILYSHPEDWHYFNQPNTTKNKRNSYTEGGMHYCIKNGAYAQMTFCGTFLRWISDKGPDRGKAKVYIDGEYSETVDLYNSEEILRQKVYETVWEKAAEHTIKIEVYDPESEFKKVVIDSIDHGDSYVYQHNMWLQAQVGCGFNYSMWGVAANGVREYFYESLKNCTIGRGRVQKVIDFYQSLGAPEGWNLEWWKLKPMWLDDNWSSWVGKEPQLPIIKGDCYGGAQGFRDIVIYYPRLSPTIGKLYNLSPINGRTYKFTWYNPQTGNYTPVSQTNPVCNGVLQLPEKVGDDDSVLWLRY